MNSNKGVIYYGGFARFGGVFSNVIFKSVNFTGVPLKRWDISGCVSKNDV